MFTTCRPHTAQSGGGSHKEDLAILGLFLLLYYFLIF